LLKAGLAKEVGERLSAAAEGASSAVPARDPSAMDIDAMGPPGPSPRQANAADPAPPVRQRCPPRGGRAKRAGGWA